MKLREILIQLKGRQLYQYEEMLEREYKYAVATDMMSNVMLGNVDDSILITSLVNPQVIRASEMMNISCIIITGGKAVTDTMTFEISNHSTKHTRMRKAMNTLCMTYLLTQIRMLKK